MAMVCLMALSCNPTPLFLVGPLLRLTSDELGIVSPNRSSPVSLVVGCDVILLSLVPDERKQRKKREMEIHCTPHYYAPVLPFSR